MTRNRRTRGEMRMYHSKSLGFVAVQHHHSGALTGLNDSVQLKNATQKKKVYQLIPWTWVGTHCGYKFVTRHVLAPLDHYW